MRKLRPKRAGKTNCPENEDQLEKPKDDFADFEKERLTSKPNAGGLLNHALTIIIGTIILMVLATSHFKTDVYGLLRMLYRQANEITGQFETRDPSTSNDETSNPTLVFELTDPNDSAKVTEPLNQQKLDATIFGEVKDTRFAQFKYWYYIFDDDFSGTKWDLSEPITWAVVPNNTGYRTKYAKSKRISKISHEQEKILREAFNSWNTAVSKTIFAEVNDWSRAKLFVGVPTDWEKTLNDSSFSPTFDVKGSNTKTRGIWHASLSKKERTSGSIELSGDLSDANFKTMALHEIGNILGFGDIVLSTFKSPQSQEGKHPFHYIKPQSMDVKWLHILYREHFSDVPIATLIDAEVQGAVKKSFKKSAIEFPASCTRFTNQTLEFEITLSELGEISNVLIAKDAMCDQYAAGVADVLLHLPEITLFRSLNPREYEENNQFQIIFYSGKRASFADDLLLLR